MSTSLLFDENFGRPIVRALAELFSFHRPRPRVAHLLERFADEGDKDEDWIPKCAREDWIVISADAGKRGRSKLPRICREFGVRHVLLVGQLVHRQQFEKVRAVLVVWPELFMITERPRGSRFKVKLAAGRPILESVLDTRP